MQKMYDVMTDTPFSVNRESALSDRIVIRYSDLLVNMRSFAPTQGKSSHKRQNVRPQKRTWFLYPTRNKIINHNTKEGIRSCENKLGPGQSRQPCIGTSEDTLCCSFLVPGRT
jgi:hypothetical protein